MAPGVNFINILCTCFCTKFWRQKLQSCVLGLKFFGAKISAKKARLKCWWNWWLIIKQANTQEWVSHKGLKPRRTKAVELLSLTYWTNNRVTFGDQTQAKMSIYKMKRYFTKTVLPFKIQKKRRILWTYCLKSNMSVSLLLKPNRVLPFLRIIRPHWILRILNYQSCDKSAIQILRDTLGRVDKTWYKYFFALKKIILLFPKEKAIVQSNITN